MKREEIEQTEKGAAEFRRSGGRKITPDGRVFRDINFILEEADLPGPNLEEEIQRMAEECGFPGRNFEIINKQEKLYQGSPLNRRRPGISRDPRQ